MVSVEYRLAPQNPHPAGLTDCVDAALFCLSAEGQRELKAPLRVLGGESPDGLRAVATALALRDNHNVNVRSQLAAIDASYGIFDLKYTPSVLSHRRAIVLSMKDAFKFMETAFGRISVANRKDPKISPLYANLESHTAGSITSWERRALAWRELFHGN